MKGGTTGRSQPDELALFLLGLRQLLVARPLHQDRVLCSNLLWPIHLLRLTPMLRARVVGVQASELPSETRLMNPLPSTVDNLALPVPLKIEHAQ